MSNGYISMRGWEKHQHYKDRNPPWIKIHKDLLNDYNFSCLQTASKAHVMMMWLLASQMDNKIPADAKWIANRIGCDNDKIDLKELISKGFIRHDSDALADCKQDDTTETETETETKTETEKVTRKKRASALQENWTLPDDYRDYCKTKRPDLDPDVTAENFLDYYLSHGKMMVDWRRTWQRWVRNERGSRKTSNRTGNKTISPATANRQAAADYFGRRGEGNGDPVAEND